jgi:hypothetical protein
MTQAATIARPDSLSGPHRRPEVVVTFRSIRPSLLDLRFSGDAWVAAPKEGLLVLCLGSSPLARINGLSLDQASLNALVNQVRHRRPRWRLGRRTNRVAS